MKYNKIFQLALVFVMSVLMLSCKDFDLKYPNKDEAKLVALDVYFYGSPYTFMVDQTTKSGVIKLKYDVVIPENVEIDKLLMPRGTTADYEVGDEVTLVNNGFTIKVTSPSLKTETYTFKFENLENLIFDADGNAYGEVVIGNQTWLDRDLITKKYMDGSEIPELSFGTTLADVWDDTAKDYLVKVPGNKILYNWAAVYKKSKGVCPAGYAVPTVADADELVAFINANKGDKSGLEAFKQDQGFGASAIGAYEPSGAMANTSWAIYMILDKDGWPNIILGTDEKLERVWWGGNRASSIRCIKKKPLDIPQMKDLSIEIADKVYIVGINETTKSGKISLPVGVDMPTEIKIKSTKYVENASSSATDGKIIPIVNGQFTITVNSLTKSVIYTFTIETLPSSVSDVDGNEYKLLLLGTQVWFDRDLATTKFPNGTAIDEITFGTKLPDGDASPNFKAFVKTPKTATVKAVLYSFGAALKACPTGYRMPTTADIKTLTSYIKDNKGTKTSLIQAFWTKNTKFDLNASSDSPFYDPRNVNDVLGFNSYPSGTYENDGALSENGNRIMYLINGEGSGTWAHVFVLDSNNNNGDLQWWGGKRASALRCIKE